MRLVAVSVSYRANMFEKDLSCLCALTIQNLSRCLLYFHLGEEMPLVSGSDGHGWSVVLVVLLEKAANLLYLHLGEEM